MAWLELGAGGTWVCKGRWFRGGRHWVTDEEIISAAEAQKGVEVDLRSPPPEGEEAFVPAAEPQNTGPLTLEKLQGGRKADPGESEAPTKVDEPEAKEPPHEVPVQMPAGGAEIGADVKVNPDKAPKKGKPKVKEEPKEA